MSIFNDDYNQIVQDRVIEKLNNAGDDLKLTTRSSPRSVGDGIQDYLSNNMPSILRDEFLGDFNGDFSRRAMADFAFRDRSGNYYVVDIKTHCLTTKFNMPNLVSVQRLSKFLEVPTNYFCIMYVAYELTEERWKFSDCKFVPIEFLNWNCLTIGALGWGQIQIANANTINIKPQERRAWMLELCNVLINFYPREIGKIEKRLTHFKSIHQRWLVHAEEQD